MFKNSPSLFLGQVAQLEKQSFDRHGKYRSVNAAVNCALNINSESTCNCSGTPIVLVSLLAPQFRIISKAYKAFISAAWNVSFNRLSKWKIL
jgi:hypothetical protein